MSDDLESALVELARAIGADEPGTLSYEVFVGASTYDPSATADAVPHRLPDAQQQAVTFEETFEDRAAFERHLNGEPFTRFRTSYLRHFYEDPDRPGWPAATTTFLHRVAAADR